MSGLVRGNRRKAIFAFKGLFQRGICHVFASGQWFFIAVFGSAGKSETSEHKPIFGNKTAGRGGLKQGSGRQASVLLRTSESACQKYAANSGIPEHTAFFT